MALIKCPECGNSISDKSKMCVHCGFPMDGIEIPTIVKRKCAYCGKVNTGYKEECESCGADLEEVKTYIRKKKPKVAEEKETSNRRICSKCGKIIPVFDEYCVSCHKEKQKEILKKLHEENLAAIEKEPKYKGITLVLCLFLGIFGAHKFYEEKMGMGFLYFFTGGLFGIGWMIDLIIILFKPNTYYV